MFVIGQIIQKFILEPIQLTNFLSRIGTVESKGDIAKVAQGLIFLSNAGGRDDIRIEKRDERIKEIRKLLKIESFN